MTRPRTVMLAFVAAAACAAGSVAGCGDNVALPSMKMGVPSPALVGANLFIVEATLNGHPGGRLLIDTGSPFTLVSPALFPGATVPMTVQVTVNIGLASVTVDGVSAINEMGGTMDRLRVAGIAGGNLLDAFSVGFNYRDQLLELGDAPAPADVAQPGTDVPFALEGGGTVPSDTGTVTFPATRIPLTVNVEGTAHPFLLDSGASEITVRSSLFDALTADGRAHVGGFPVTTVSGPGTGQITRTRSLDVGGEIVTNAPTLTIGDSLLDNVAAEVGHPIDGLLGGSYLREFFLTVDYPRGVVHLQRYATRDHIVDEFQRVGISLGPTNTGGYAAAAVYPGTDAAAKGVALGDEVVTVDGQTLSALDPIAAERTLEGAVGTSRVLGFGAASSPTVRGAQIALRVDDLVPAPAAN